LSGEGKFSSVNHDVHRDEVIDTENGIRMKYKGRKIYNNDYFFRKSGIGSVLLRRDPHGDRRMYECPFRIVGQLSNFRSSIVEHPITVPVVNYIEDCNRLLRNQGMQGQEWATIVSPESQLFLQDVEDLAPEDPVVIDKGTVKLIEIDARAVSEAKIRRINYKMREVKEKTVEDKILSTIKDQDFGPQFKQKKFVQHFFSESVLSVAKNKFAQDKEYLDSVYPREPKRFQKVGDTLSQ